MKTIIIIIPVWKRNDVFNLCVKQLDVFCHTDKVNIIVLYILSVTDPEVLLQLETIKAAQHRNYTIFSDNDRLGKKINDGLLFAENLEYDYIMNAGSDDLFHPNLIDLYLPFMELQLPFFGLSGVYFYENGSEPFLFEYYNGNHLVGAGRMIHRTVIQSVVKEHGGLYPEDICRSMDTFSAIRILAKGTKQNVIYSGDFPYVVDVKSEVNINSFANIEHAAKHKNCYETGKYKLNELFSVLNE